MLLIATTGVAQRLELAAAPLVFCQYDPLLLSLRFHNDTQATILGGLDAPLRVERRTADGSWEAVTPWPDPMPWGLDIVVRREARRLPDEYVPGHVEWKHWGPVPTPATIVPGTYRILGVRLEGSELHASDPVELTVLPHAANAVFFAANRALHAKLIDGALCDANPRAELVEYATAIVGNAALSAPIREWTAVQLSQYHFDRRAYDLSERFAAAAVSSKCTLPWGGLPAEATYFVLRAKWMQCTTQEQWDAVTRDYRKLTATFPEFERAYGPSLYTTRRELLPPR